MKEKKVLLGAHTSTAGGIHRALLEGQEIGATVIQFFTTNQKQWQGRKITPEIIVDWEKTIKETQLSHIMSHDSYLINLGSPRDDILAKSREAFLEEVHRCNALHVDYLNFHPGAALKETVEECLDKIIESILLIKPHMTGNLRLLLESTAGQGSTVGCRFEELAYILRGVQHHVPIGICIDTCHLFAAGYDIRTPTEWEKVLAAFDEIIGLQHLYAFHLNDSKTDLGSRVDRHANLGEGKIGWDCFSFLMNDKRTQHLPKYLETPGGPSMWKQEIKQLTSMIGNESNKN